MCNLYFFLKYLFKLFINKIKYLFYNNKIKILNMYIEDFNRQVQFTKCRDVKTPNRANKHDAGTDFFVPFYNQQFLEDIIIKNKGNKIFYTLDYEDDIPVLFITIPAGEQVMIPSGIKVWILDKRTYLQATNKSGVASKFHLDVMANTIDADYQGEVHINLSNNGNTDITIRTGQKLVQFIHQIYLDTEWEEIPLEDYNNIKISDRGAGMAGSTGIF